MRQLTPCIKCGQIPYMLIRSEIWPVIGCAVCQYELVGLTTLAELCDLWCALMSAEEQTDDTDHDSQDSSDR